MTREIDRTELRAHPRIAAPARAFLLSGARGSRELPVRDLSLGGMLLLAPPGLFTVGEESSLELTLPDGGFTVPVRARAVREAIGPEGEAGVGLKFVDPDAVTRNQLAELMRRLLSGTGGNRRAYPRISHRVSVTCAGAKKVRALLKDLSLGGAGLWLDTPLAMEEVVTLSLDRDGTSPLELRARVVTTRWAMDDDPYDQAGVEFVDLDEGLRLALRDYLMGLLGVRA